MLPKSSKHYIQPTAEQLNIPLQKVEDIVGFYYSTLRKTVTDLKCHNIQVENLGSFKAMEKELPKLISKYQKHLSVLTKETFAQMTIRKETQAKLEKVIALQKQVNADKKRKQEFFKKKKDDNTRNNLESTQSNS